MGLTWWAILGSNQ